MNEFHLELFPKRKSFDSQYCLRKLNQNSWKTEIYIHHFFLTKIVPTQT